MASCEGRKRKALEALPPQDEAGVDLKPHRPTRACATYATRNSTRITATTTSRSTSRFFDRRSADTDAHVDADTPPSQSSEQSRKMNPTGNRRGRVARKVTKTPKMEELQELPQLDSAPPLTKRIKHEPEEGDLAATPTTEISSTSAASASLGRRCRGRSTLSRDPASTETRSDSVRKTGTCVERGMELGDSCGGTRSRSRRAVKKEKDEAVCDEPSGTARRSARGDESVKVERPPRAGARGAGGKAGTTRGRPPPGLVAKASLIIEVMDVLYPDPPIPIDHKDNFTLLCGVLLSAQTTDAQVNLVTKELFKVAPDPLSMSKMSQEEVQRIIRSVGLAPTKAKHLIALSRQLLDRFDGQVPDTHAALQSLPGVGRKTASVVMSQAFGLDTFPVDTHIHRLALRWGLTKNDKNANKVEEDLMWVFPRQSWSKLHLQLIYFGREYCQAKSHDTSACPVCSWVKKTGAKAPKTLPEIGSLQEVMASPTPPKKFSKNAIVYSERHLELEKFRMKLED